MDLNYVDEVRDFLGRIEARKRTKVQYFVSPVQSIGKDVQVIVYPSDMDAVARTFNLQDGLTRALEQEIRSWFEPFLPSVD